MAANTAKQQNDLVDYYVKKYTEKFGAKPLFNRQNGTWIFKSMLYDYTIKDIRSLIDYYIEKYPRTEKDLTWFGYNYDKLVQQRGEYEDEIDNINRLRRESEERTRLWKEKVERIKGNQRNPEER